MPSWPARLLSSSHGQTHPHLTSSPDRPTRPREEAFLGSPTSESLVAIPTLHPSPRLQAAAGSVSPSRESRHGRSHSHPFPSIFGYGKRSEKASPVDDDALAHELTDDEAVFDRDSAPGHAFIRRGKSKGGGGGGVNADKDLTTGHCFTCESQMRWPRTVKTFRCSVCGMVNDLKPWTLEDFATPQTAGSSKTPTGSVPLKLLPLSVERTNSIIDHCITTFLERRRLNNRQRSRSPVPPASRDDPPRNVRRGSGAGLLEVLNAEPANSSTSPKRIFPGPMDRENSVVDQAGGLSQSCPGSTSPGFERMHEAGLSNIRPLPPSRDPPRPPDETASDRTGPMQSEVSSSGLGSAFPSTLRERPQQASGNDRGRPPGGERRNAVFGALEDYLVDNFRSWQCINSSFPTSSGARHPPLIRAASEGTRKWAGDDAQERSCGTGDTPGLSNVDAKTLLLGDFAENGSWWSGGRDAGKQTPRSAHGRNTSSAEANANRDLVNSKSPRIDWTQVNLWYSTVLHAGKNWEARAQALRNGEGDDEAQDESMSQEERQDIECQIDEARYIIHRKLLKATENLLKRPGRPLKRPEEIRFLLIILANPLLYTKGPSQPTRVLSNRKDLKGSPSRLGVGNASTADRSPRPRLGPGQHSSIVKRVFGLLSNLPHDCHVHLVAWFSRYSESHFRRTVDLVGGFVTYRLGRERRGNVNSTIDPTAGLIPDLGGSSVSTSAQLHAALGVTGPSHSSSDQSKSMDFSDDWQIKAAAKVMAMLFTANNSGLSKKTEAVFATKPSVEAHSVGLAARQRAHQHGQLLPTSDFYNTLLDYCDLVADFENWESRRGKFSFCQYPFFLSIWAKIKVLEFDARRQMESRAREAFFDSILSHKVVQQHLVLKVRRDCLVEDSLKSVSEVVGTGLDEIKKGLRIVFLGEEGVDAGGLRKEWFLLLVREIFDPHHGMFIYDEQSHFCYFNPHCFETSDQFFLVGVLLGLAIYNSTILDIPFPPFMFKKLLAAAPNLHAPTPTNPARVTQGYHLEDLAELRPALAKGLRQLLEFDGNVEETFCRDFVAETERYGQVVLVPLCPSGENRPVTKANRREFVDLYVRFLLDGAVSRQFEPFKRGFYTVCGGNALSLFRPEEIELLVRGSDEPLDISSLRAVANYENWGVPNPGETEPVVQWFWDFFTSASPSTQRTLLGFITGSDRIPAMGATNLIIRVSCFGSGDSERFPIARTCFNMLGLWRYGTRAKLEGKLWAAVTESEGFGLK